MGVLTLIYFAIGYYFFWLVIKDGPTVFADLRFRNFVFGWTAIVWAIFLWPIPVGFALYAAGKKIRADIKSGRITPRWAA